MTRYFAVATYATPRGAMGRWSGPLLAPDIATAMLVVERIVTGSRRVAGKLDIQITAVKEATQ